MGKNSKHIIVLGIVLTLLFGFLFIGRKSYVTDEVFNLLEIKDFNTLRQISWREDVNMWFYYFILFFWSKLGTSEIIVRSLSVIFSVMTIPVFYNLTRELFNKKIANIALILLSFNFFFIYNSQLARSYSLLTFLTTCSSLFFLKALKNNKSRDWLGYVLITLLAVYSHLYAVLLIISNIASYGFLKDRKYLLKKYFISLVITGIGILPLLLAPSFNGHSRDWFANPTLLSIIGTLIVLAGDNPLILTIFFSLSLLYFLKSKSPQKNWNLIFTILWLFIPILLAFAWSIFFKPAYQSVSFSMILVPFIILFSIFLDKLNKRRWIYKFLLCAVIITSIVRLWSWYGSSPTLKLVFSNYSEAWQESSSYIAVNSNKDDAIIFYIYTAKDPFYYYYKKNYPYLNKPKLIEISSSSYSRVPGGKIPYPNIKILKSLNLTYKRVWLVLNNDTGQHLDRDKQKRKIISSLSQDFKVEKHVNLPGINLILYAKKYE